LVEWTAKHSIQIFHDKNINTLIVKEFLAALSKSTENGQSTNKSFLADLCSPHKTGIEFFLQ
jgi:hypothetical protein